MTILIREIAEKVGGTVSGNADLPINGAAPFETARADELTFARDRKFSERLEETGAGAIIVPISCQCPGKNLILVKNPYPAFARALQLLYPPKIPAYMKTPEESGAVLGKGFSAGEDPRTGPFVSLGDNVTLGDRVRIHPNTVIEDDVIIGDDVTIHSCVTIREGTIIGNRVIINAGSVIGSDGFGFAPDNGAYCKIPHTGIVRIDDDVEIGAGNTIDRATFGETRICRGVKTDNLVHIAHNVTVGEDTVLVAQVGIAGSTSIGRNSILAGQVGVTGHVRIGDRVTIGPQSGIAKDIPDDGIVSGSPEMPHRLWLKVQQVIPRLPELAKRIRHLEKQSGDSRKAE